MSSLYRRHRPQNFAEVVGQEHVVRTLRNAVEQGKVHHAYLFVGSRGTGKTSMARILARSLNCEQGPTAAPCGECESCLAIAGSTSMDVIEVDAASNRLVDDVRELLKGVGFMPTAGRWKVYILDEAHMLTKEGWNTFLKTLEEPPPNTIFVLATTEAHKVMPTVVDRCQRFDFQRPSLEQIAEVVGRVAVSEGVEIAEPAVAAIARSATGSFRDALGTLDQLVAYGGSKVALDDVLTVLGVADAELLFEVAEAMVESDPGRALVAVDEVARTGRDLPQFGRDLIAHMRHLLVVRATGAVPESFSVTAAQGERLRAQAERIAEDDLIEAIEGIASALTTIKEGGDARVMLEVALLKSVCAGGPRPPAAAVAAPRPEPARPEPSPEPARQAESRPQPQAVPQPPAQAEAAPEPEPGPPEEPEPTSEPRETAPLDLDGLRRAWPAIVEHIANADEMVLSSSFAGTQPVGVDASSFTVGFPPAATFNKKRAEDRANRLILAEAVRAVTGHAFQPHYALLDGGEPEMEPPKAEPGLSEEDLLARFKEEFNAEEIEAPEVVEAETAPVSGD